MEERWKNVLGRGEREGRSGAGAGAGAWGAEIRVPVQLVEMYNLDSSEIELLCLHVGSRVEAECSSLSGGDQARVFVNLASGTRHET